MPSSPTDTSLVGVLSDTHGRLDPRVATVFRDVDHIVHAGDIGHPSVLDELLSIAPTDAVLGNTDPGRVGFVRQDRVSCLISGVRFVIVHDPAGLDRAALSPDLRVVVSGHTRVPSVERRDGIVWLNPGSVSRPRGGRPPGVALLTIRDARIDVRFVDL